MYMCIFHYFNYYLPDFLTAISLRFIFGFSFLDIFFNVTKCHNKPLMEDFFMTRSQALRLWSGSTDSKASDYQRTNPRECQIVRTDTKGATWIQDPVSPNTSSTLYRTPHLNKKQTKNTSPIISRQDYDLTQPCPSEEKQTNKQTNRNSA